MCVLPCDRFFTAIWALIKPWIDPVTSDKIQILGSDFLPTLREHIEDSQIPPELGGSAEGFYWTAPAPEEYGGSYEQMAAKLDWGPSIYDDCCREAARDCGEGAEAEAGAGAVEEAAGVDEASL
jgi:hypothetical protein